MTYPRNASSPPGIMAQLRDELSRLPVTSGITVYHVPSGGARQAAAGSETHRGDGCWEYVPTQAETDHETFAIQWVSAGICYETTWVTTETVTSGSGARSVTVTVDDGSDPLENATVRYTKGSESYTATTNASGNCSFSLDDGTWTVAITLAGYTFTPTTLVVDGDETPTYSMSQVVTPGSSPGQVKGYIYCYDEDGSAEEGASVSIWVHREGSTDGYAYSEAVRTELSDATGLIEFTGLFKGVTYEYRLGANDRAYKITIPTDAGDPYELASIVGD